MIVDEESRDWLFHVWEGSQRDDNDRRNSIPTSRRTQPPIN